MKQFVASAFALCASGMLLAQAPAKPAAASPAAPKLVETVTKKGTELVIPYKKYMLPNGMTVVVHEDHSDPVVYVDVTYHVGSAREQQGRSGFAHFFEHMMFQGSKHVADEQHFKIITEAGGTLNGSTNTDRTNYFETVPSNQLEKMLWLEADRMGFLLDSVTQRKFEVQRATVKNERGQRYDNAPYGLVGEKTGEALYPKGHPYSWTTIGYIEDLNRVDVNDLKRFYMRWYGPNNAVLTVAGDVNTDEVVKLAEKYFGSIPRGPEVKPQAKQAAMLTGDRYISYEDNIRFPLVKLTFPTVPSMHKDEAALEALGEILSSSKSSPFYIDFIKAKKAVSANAYNYSRELAGQFEMQVRANNGSKLSDIEADIRKSLDNWEKNGGATDDDIAKYKASYQSNLYNGLSTVQGKGTQLAANQTYAGNPNYLKTELANVMKLTKADVMRVYNTYIKGKHAVVLSCVPKGKGELKAHEDTWKMYERRIEQESAEYKNLSYTEPKDNFDRGAEPKPAAAKLVPLPEFWEAELANKAKVIGVNSNDIPKVNVQISFWSGHRFEDPAKAGTAYMLSSIMGESTEKHSAEEIGAMLERLGSDVAFYCTENEFGVNISCLSQNLDATMAIAEEMFTLPKFSNEDFELVKKEQLDGIANQATRATAIADNGFSKLIYGKGSILSVPVLGTAETVNKITIDDLKAWYRQLSARGITVAVIGDVTKEKITTKLAFVNKLPAPSASAPKNPEAAPVAKTKLYFIDKKGAPQSEIRVGAMSIPYDATGEFYRNMIMNYSFAGAFNSRVNYLLREVRGFTYGARGGFYGNKFAGPYIISAGVRGDATDSSVVDVMNELKKYADTGINADELSFTRNAMGQADALKYESPFQKLAFIKRLVDYSLDKAYVAQQAEILKSVKKEEIDALAKKALPYNNMVILVVGDKAANYEKLSKLGYEIVELDLNAEPVK